jgi:acetylornithine/N-succinyldiaminopimelate aminotransferase
MNSVAIKSLFDRYVMPTYAPDQALVKGKGTRVWDADGKVYLDMIAGIAVVNAGHCHPRITAAMQEQFAQLVHVSNLYYTENEARLAERLSVLAYKGQGKCFFANSGAEANEGLIKLARLWGRENGRHEIVTMTNSFHGRTLATAAATGQDKIKLGFEPLPEGFVHAEYNTLQSVEAAITDKTAAILLEAVQGEGGIVPAEPDFIDGVRALCDEHDILMLCDEVQCGMGRTGHWFGFQSYGVVPDAFSLAKALGNGYPIGAVVGGPKTADVFQPGKHASTFGGTPAACAAALATLDVLTEEGLLQRAERVGAKLRAGLESFVGRYERVAGVRARGMMLGLVLNVPAKPLTASLAKAGVLTLATAEHVVRLLPPLNVKDSEVEETLEIMEECLDAWHGVGGEGDDAV